MNKLFTLIFISLVSSVIIWNQIDKPMSKAEMLGIVAEKSPKRDQPGEAVAWMNQFLESSASDKSPTQLNQLYSKEILHQESLNGPVSTFPDFNFEELGPGVFGGRVRAFTTLPSDSDVLLTGGVSGGVWKSVNGGQTWQANTDFLPTLAVSSMVRDPNNENIVYMGTGEGFFNVDAQRGAGIFVSNDFGDTWTQLASTDNSDFHYVNRIAKINGQNILLAATRTGIHRSTDGGTSWSEVSGHSVAGRGFVDLKTDPSDSSHVLAVHYGNPNGQPTVVTINSPGSIAGDYNAALATFGPQSFNVTDNIELVNDGSGTTSDGCQALVGFTSGNIALLDRGGCPFTQKVQNAENAGASAVIVANNEPGGGVINMGGTDPGLSIGSVMISLEDGQTIRNEFPSVIDGTVGQSGPFVFDRFVMQSTDAGATWSILNDSDGLPDTDVGRIEVAFGTDGVIYAAVANEADQTRGLWRSDGLGNEFRKTNSNTAFVERQGWYDLVLAVDPSDSDKVLMGAVDQFISTNAGGTITKNTFWSPGAGQIPEYVHADQHIYYFDPTDSNTVYVGSDGGIFRSTDGGNTYENINNNFFVSQSYGIAVKPDGTLLTSGTQDNGSQLYFGDDNVWLEWRGGDGGYSAWDQQNGNYVYGSNPRGGMFGSNNNGVTVLGINLPDTTGAAFIQPFTLDPNDGNRMLVGTDNLFYSANIRSLGSASFTDVSGTIGQVSATTISSVNGSQAFGGTISGVLVKIDNLGVSNDVTNISAGLQNGSDITDIYVDPTDVTGDTLIVTQADYAANRISRSTNGGASWTSVSGNLPDIPLFAVVSDPSNPDTFFVGSELGLFVTEDITTVSPVWNRYDFGPAFTRVIDLVWNNDNLYIGTHGRGTYKASRDLVGIALNEVQVTDMVCDNDDVLDVGETANVMIEFTNLGGFDITGAVANVTSSADIDITSPMVVLSDFSDSLVQAFEITLNESDSCPGSIQLDITVTHNSGSTTGSVDVGVQQDIIVSNATFEDGAEGAGYMSSELVMGSTGWSQVNTQANTGSSSWFTTNEGNYSDKSLRSPWITSTGANVLTFALFYDTEGDNTQRWDGAVLELRTATTDWFDIGQLSTVPYDGVLFNNNSAPARMAWSGNQRSWREATVDLGTAYQGQEIQFRFRMVSDGVFAEEGFWVDDIAMTNVEWISEVQCDSCVSSNDLIFEDGFE
jgi:hypothetical protein